MLNTSAHLGVALLHHLERACSGRPGKAPADKVLHNVLHQVQLPPLHKPSLDLRACMYACMIITGVFPVSVLLESSANQYTPFSEHASVNLTYHKATFFKKDKLHISVLLHLETSFLGVKSQQHCCNLTCLTRSNLLELDRVEEQVILGKTEAYMDTSSMNVCIPWP